MSQYYYNPFGSGSDMDAARDARFQIEQRAKQEKKEIRSISFAMGCAIIAYLIIQTVLSEVLVALDLIELYKNSALFQYAFTIVSVSIGAVAVPFGIMALCNKKKYVHPIIPTSKIKPLNTVAWIFFGVLCCTAANIIVSYIVLISKELFGYNLTQGETASPDSVLACIMEFIGLAVVPAICEEFAMRCCSLQLLRKFGIGFSVFSVSIVFGLLHGNIIQFMFAFIIGLVLAFVTIKTESIVPAIFIHAINNGLSVVQDILKNFTTDKTADNAVVIFYILFAVLGILSLIYLVIKKEFKKNTAQRTTVLSNGEKISAFLFPWMIVPFVILIALTLTTIKKA